MLRRWTLAALVVAVAAVAPMTTVATSGGNEAPLADAGLDQHVELGATVLLDATGSRDPDGEVASYDWRIETPGGGTIVPQCPTCGRTQFLPGEAGTYVVTVTVTDDQGVQSTDTLYVTVQGSSSEAEPPERRSGTPDSTSSAQSPQTPATDGVPVTNPPGADPSSPAGGLCAGDSSSCVSNQGTEPWVEIIGPARVQPDQEVGFVLQYGGFEEEPQFGWSTGIAGVRGRTFWNAPGDETIYVTAASDTQVARDTHDVRVTDNRKPKVDIQVPENVHPGQTITLSAEMSDPDGRIVSVEWENGPSVRVPNDGEEGVSISVVDDKGGNAIDQVAISSDSIQEISSDQSTARHTVYCYYNQKPERLRQAPDHCEVKGSDNSPDSDGFQPNTANVDRVLRSPHYNVIWKKTEREITQHSGNLGDDVGVRMPDVIDNDGTHPTIPTLSDGQRDAIVGNAVGTSSQSFTMDGKTVTNDLDGDGKIDAADWDERFGTNDRSAADNHRDAVAEAKDARRATNQAYGGGGPTSSDSGNAEDEPTSGNSNGDRSASEQSDPLGGALPDDLTISEPDAAHIAAKQQDIVENGLDGGLY